MILLFFYRNSSLTPAEHVLFLDLQEKFTQYQQRNAALQSSSSITIPPLFDKETTNLMFQLKDKVLQEQEEYRRLQYTEAIQNKEIYRKTIPQIENQLEVIALVSSF